MNCAAFILALSFHTLPGYNTYTPGIGVDCDKVAAMHYQNSEGGTSEALILKAKMDTDWSLFLGAAIGGYKEHDFIPLGGVLFRKDHWFVTVMPPVPKYSGVLSVGFVF